MLEEDIYLGAISKLSNPAKTRFLVAKTRALEEENAKLKAELKITVSAISKLSFYLENTRSSLLICHSQTI